MGKNDFLTPKAIANRIKAKGLTKLRFYCQMCQKMCRDENGFKCHLTSDGHKRQMEIFGQNPDRVVDGYSEEFESAFMDHMRIAHPRARIEAHKVYNEVIQDRHHIHMNATKWHTLTEFVKYLGREGLCKVEDTPKGWFISLIHRDEEQELAEEGRAKRLKKEADEETRNRRAMEAQIARARQAEQTGNGSATQDAARGEGSGAAARDAVDGAPSQPRGEFRRDPDAAPLKLSLGGGGAREREGSRVAGKRPAELFSEEGGGAGGGGFESRAKKSKGQEIMERELAKRQAAEAADGSGKASASERHENWLCKGIVIKVMAKALKDAGYYKAKGEVISVIDRFVAEVEMADTGDIVRVDQAELETVIPKPGGCVKVVNGEFRGGIGTVEELLVDKFKARVQLADGTSFLADYEDICKLRA